MQLSFLLSEVGGGRDDDDDGRTDGRTDGRQASLLLLLTLEGRGLVNLVSFRDFLKLVGVVYLPA